MLSLKKIFDRVVVQDGRRERKLACGLAKRESGIGTRQSDAYEANVLRSGQRNLHGDAGLAGVEGDAFGDELRLGIARIVTERECRWARIGEQSFRALHICLR